MTRGLAERLGTLHGASASALREEALEACREEADASVALFIRPTPDADGVIRYGDVTATGPPRLRSALTRLDGRPMHEGSVADAGKRVMSARRGSWSLHTPCPRHTNRFSPLDADMSLERMEQTASYREVYEPLRIVDQARMLAMDGRRVLAWFGVMNQADHGPILPRALEALNRAAARVVAIVRSADALDRWSGGSGFATFLASGRLEAATPNVAHWWRVEERERVARCVRELDRDPGAPSELALRGAAVQLLRMDAPGSVRYLAAFEGAPLVTSPFARLSARRRQVAELAALGMTVAEIAADLGTSPNTVKTQLRHIYYELGVANRAELIRLAEGGLHLS